MRQVGVKLVMEGVARPIQSVSGRGPGLDHEILDHAMKSDALVESFVDESPVLKIERGL